ncbi:MAG: hypothetical protein AMS14_05505 [Planctomycetes bacterium DG_20]|nr:MAG: hypothetical protein AMS14_05505 [Planctomycetes bacterium DG_20]
MNRVVSCILLLAIVAVWGWTFSLMKGPVETYGVVPFLAVRFVIGSAAISLVAARRTTWRTLKVGAGIGLVLAAAYLLQTFGLRHTSATNTGLITGLFIVFAPLANRVLFGVRTRLVLWGAIGISVAGLALLSGAGPDGMAPGDALTLGAAALFGLHVALLDRHAKHHEAIVLAQGQLTAATGVFLVAWLLVAWLGVEPLVLPPPGWGTDDVWPALLVTGLVATAAAFLVQTYVQQRLRAVQTAALIVTEPLFAALFAYLLVGDRLTGLQMVGAVLMVAALILVEVYPLVRKPRQAGS